MAALTNYDKWQGVGDEEDAADRRAAPPRPVVTRLDASTAGVTIGNEGWSVTRKSNAAFDVTPAAPPPKVARAPPAKPRRSLDYSRWDHLEYSESEGEPNRYYEDDIDEEREAQWRAEALTAPRVPPPASQRLKVDATKDGGFCTRNKRIVACWSQSAEEIIARFPVGRSTKAHSVFCAVAYKNDTCQLTVTAENATLTEILCHDVWCKDDPRPTFRLMPSDADAQAFKDSLDWSLEDAVVPLPKEGRCVCVTMKKRPVADGVITWWATLFQKGGDVDEVPRDTATLESRAKRKAGTPEDFQKAWAGAHEQFLEKVKAHPGPVEVEYDTDDTGGAS